MNKEKMREIVARELARQASVNDAGFIGVTNATIQIIVDKVWKDFLPKAMGIVDAIYYSAAMHDDNEVHADVTLAQLIDRIDWLGELIIENEQERRSRKAAKKEKKANKRKAK